MTLSTVVPLTQENFVSEVLRCSAPVLVCFWAEWCGPCKIITPVLDELADEYADRVKIGRINIDEQAVLELELRRCRRVGPECYECGTTFADGVIPPAVYKRLIRSHRSRH